MNDLPGEDRLRESIKQIVLEAISDYIDAHEEITTSEDLENFIDEWMSMKVRFKKGNTSNVDSEKA